MISDKDRARLFKIGKIMTEAGRMLLERERKAVEMSLDTEDGRAALQLACTGLRGIGNTLIDTGNSINEVVRKHGSSDDDD